MFCKNCGKEHFEENVLCKECSSKLEQAQVQNNTERNIGVKSTKITMSTRNILIIVGVIVALVGGFLFYSNYKSNNVSKKVIKNDLIGTTINVGNISSFEVTEDMQKDISIDRKNVQADYSGKVFNAYGTIKVDNDNYELEVPFESSYLYNNLSKDWLLIDACVKNSDSSVKLNIKKQLTDEVILEKLTGKVTKKDTSNSKIKVNNKEKIDEIGTEYRIQGSLDYEGSLITKTEAFSTAIVFDGEDWNINGMVSTNNSEVTVSEDASSASSEEILDDIKVLFINKSISFGLTSSWNTCEINAAQISEISNISIENDYETNIKGTVKVKTEYLEADGDIELEISSSGYVSAKIEAEDVALTAPSEETIQSLLKKQSIRAKVNGSSKNITIKEDDSKTFKLQESFVENKSSRALYVFGTLTYGGLTDDEVRIRLLYNPKDNKWTVSDVISNSIEYNKSYFDKEKYKEE